MNEIILIILALSLVLVLDLVTIAARASFAQINHVRLLVLREQMESKVNRTLALLPRLTRLKASLNLALVLCRFGLAGLLLLLVYLQPIPYVAIIGAVVLLLAALGVFWLEWAVERKVSHNAEIWSIRLTDYARGLMGILALFLLPISLKSDSADLSEISSTVTEDELKTLMDAGEEEGVFQQDERKMIFSIFQLGDTLAREIMVPRIDMLALCVDTSLPDAVDTLLDSGYSRVPVYEESVDKTLGLLYAKDLLRVWREGSQLDSLLTLLRPAYFVPEGKKVDDLLTEMQSQRIHMAIVVDEYGGVAGLVTLEDIIEEVLGEIQDEYDDGEEAPYQLLKDGTYLFRGRIDLDDFNEIMESDLPTEEADTLGGYIYGRLGRVPDVGEEVREGYLLLTVEQVSARRIRKVSARWRTADEQAEEEKDHVDR